jgi:hypothetical protein
MKHRRSHRKRVSKKTSTKKVSNPKYSAFRRHAAAKLKKRHPNADAASIARKVKRRWHKLKTGANRRAYIRKAMKGK